MSRVSQGMDNCQMWQYAAELNRHLSTGIGPTYVDRAVK
jgi:hypothetical protein